MSFENERLSLRDRETAAVEWSNMVKTIQGKRRRQNFFIDNYEYPRSFQISRRGVFIASAVEDIA